VGIVLLTGIGDVVHGLPLACDLKRQDPTREVVWVAEPAPAGILEHHPAVDRIVVFHKKRGIRGVRDLFEDFRGRSCDLTINLMRYFKGVFPVLATGAPVRLGLPRSKTRDGVHVFHTHRLTEGPWCHTQDLFLRFREPLGLPLDAPVEWRLTFSAAERARQETYFQELRAGGRVPVIGVVLATANQAKDWPGERYPELVARLVGELGARVLLIGGPSARERDVARKILAEAPDGVTDGLGDSVRRMMWMVDGVDLLISPDTGPLHVAHALDVPVVGLFGHTNPWRVGPWRRSHGLMVDRYTDADESPDPARYDPRHGRMETILVDDVMVAVQRGLPARPRDPSAPRSAAT
jgi:heptosyltransferase I